jgi:hypothetical protein
MTDIQWFVVTGNCDTRGDKTQFGTAGIYKRRLKCAPQDFVVVKIKLSGVSAGGYAMVATFKTL